MLWHARLVERPRGPPHREAAPRRARGPNLGAVCGRADAHAVLRRALATVEDKPVEASPQLRVLPVDDVTQLERQLLHWRQRVELHRCALLRGPRGDPRRWVGWSHHACRHQLVTLLNVAGEAFLDRLKAVSVHLRAGNGNGPHRLSHRQQPAPPA